MAAKKIIRPRVIQRRSNFWEQNFQRLMENPIYEQLEFLQRNAEDRYGKNFAIDLFVLTFSNVLDFAPNLSLTSEQHEEFYCQIMIACTQLSAKWTEEFRLMIKEEGITV